MSGIDAATTRAYPILLLDASPPFVRRLKESLQKCN